MKEFKLPIKEVFDLLPKNIKNSYLKKYFKNIIDNCFYKNNNIHENINNLLKSNEYPSDELLIEIKRLKHSLKTRRCKPYKENIELNNKKKRKALSKKFRKNKEHKFILKNNKLNTSYLSEKDFEIWNKHFKYLHNVQLSLVDYQILFNTHKSYKKIFVVNNKEFKVLYPTSYTTKCCTCNNNIIISRNFQIELDELFCLDCEVVLEKGAIYLNELISSLNTRFKDIQNKKNKTLKKYI